MTTARAYRADAKIVVDVDKDTTVQLRTDSSAWHRRAIGGLTTACGQPIDHHHHGSLRHESYEGQLCTDGCFSAFELLCSERVNHNARTQED